MAAATMRRATRLVFIASLLPSCGTSQSTGTMTGTRGGDGDAGDAGEAGPEPVCAFVPCGGDLVGNWTIQQACPAPMHVQDCPIAELEPKDVTVSGTFSFGTDGGLTFDITSSGAWEGVVPSSCVAGTDCASIAVSLYQVNAPPASCTSDDDGGCSCSSPATPTQTDTRPYLVSGNTAAYMSYCVRDGLLKLQNEAGTVFVASK